MTQNVSWPTWKELQSNALIVVVASVIFALIVFLMDTAFGVTAGMSWKGALGFIYSML
jgi:preprotein translocase subunit SecE